MCLEWKSRYLIATHIVYVCDSRDLVEPIGTLRASRRRRKTRSLNMYRVHDVRTGKKKMHKTFSQRSSGDLIAARPTRYVVALICFRIIWSRFRFVDGVKTIAVWSIKRTTQMCCEKQNQLPYVQ